MTPHRRAESDLKGNARILVADDEPAALNLLTHVLRRAGYRQLYTTTTSTDIAAMFRNIDPDIVILDLHMPHLDGVDVMREVRKRVEAVEYLPIIMITGDTSPEARWRTLLAGATDVIGKPFDPTEVVLRVQNLLEARWRQRALVSRNRFLELQVQARTEAMFASQLEVIERLTAAIEMRDGYTGQHTRRVGAMAAAIARVAGEPPDSVELIRRAAPLHDIGKIGLPDALLGKSGALDAEEIKLMQAHTVIGAELLSGGMSDVMVAATRIARSHHERWDGSGYPDGLAGEAIPFNARIVAIADVYDALTYDRPYRRALSRNEARAELARAAGSHFDPKLVAVFLAADEAALQADRQLSTSVPFGGRTRSLP